MLRGPRRTRSQRLTPAPPPPPGAVSPWVQLRSTTAHPFIYQRMLHTADPVARPGDVVNIYDKHGQLFGRGLYNPHAPIGLRVLAHGDVGIDEDFWRARLEQAVALRRRLDLAATTDAYRVVHAEGDGLSGLIAERYADCLIFELFSLGMFQRWQKLAATLSDLLGPPRSLERPDQPSPTWRTFVRADAQIEAIERFRVPSSPQDAPARLIIREHGVRYRVDVAAGHKTGFFCDQRENRLRLARLCRDADVLDLCCYTGGFGLCARLLGGARAVTGVDLDEDALALARENANLNQTRVDFVHADAFTYLRQMIANARLFDVAVLDPPKLATTRAEYDAALRKYGDLNTLALQVVRPGGVFLTCSCSGLVSPEVFVETVHRAGRRCGRTLQLFDRTGAGPDHPVLLECPESAYLKAVWLRVLKPPAHVNPHEIRPETARD
jgi:23S rRNA (cytosine1962-C5)-methyltransferase